jgi:FtsH-binding integral membrane protein
MDVYKMESQSTGTGALAVERVSTFLRAVYGWMLVGLGLTAVVAYAVASSETAVETLVNTPFLFMALILAELGLVFWLSARAATMAPSTAAGAFLVYAALNGVTLSMILLSYTGASVASTFFICAAMFGALAAYGTVSQRSLAGVGQFAFMGLVGIILASLVGLFWQSDGLQFVIACVGVLVFTGLTAYDAQRLKQMALALPEGSTGSYAVVGALSLYLDFINLFLMLLRFFGGRRD